MPTIAYIEPLKRAYGRMRHILFEPFDVSKWFVIGFGCWLANLADTTGGGSSWQSNFDAASNGWNDGWEPWFVALVVVAALLILILIPLILWLSSRGEFIFLDNVVKNRAAIKVPWHEHRTLGNSLFLWRLAFVGVVLLAVGLLVFLMVLLVAPWSGGDFEPSCSIIAVAVLSLGTVVISAIFVDHFLIQFVVPIMFREGLRSTRAWRRFLPLFSEHLGSFVLYALFVFSLWIVVLIGLVFAVVLTCCLAAIPLILPYIGTVVLLPVFVTMRALGLEFLAQFSPDFEFFAPQGTETNETEPAV